MTGKPRRRDRTAARLSDPRLTRADTPLGRLLFARNLSYEKAAAQIRAHFAEANPGDTPLRLGTALLAAVARGEREPQLRTARAIVAWSGKAIALGELVTLI